MIETKLIQTSDVVLDLIKGILDCFNANDKKLCDSYGITVAEGRIILNLQEGEELFVNLIAEKMELSKSRISRLIESLRKKKLITKREMSDDHRFNIIVLTEKGLKLRESLISNRLALCSDILKTIPQEKLEVVVSSLEILKEAYLHHKNKI